MHFSEPPKAKKQALCLNSRVSSTHCPRQSLSQQGTQGPIFVEFCFLLCVYRCAHMNTHVKDCVWRSEDNFEGVCSPNFAWVLEINFLSRVWQPHLASLMGFHLGRNSHIHLCCCALDCSMKLPIHLAFVLRGTDPKRFLVITVTIPS